MTSVTGDKQVIRLKPMLETLINVAPIVVAAIALFTLIKAFFEYRQRNMLTRIELYLEMRDKYARDQDVQKVCASLGGGKPAVTDLTYIEKRLFLGTMESVALLVNSNVINKNVAMYMFGYFVLAAWENDEFWGDGNLIRDDPMWALYKWFAEDLIAVRTEYEKDPSTIVENDLNFFR